MDSIEITAKSVQEARQAAAKRLNVSDPESLTVTVLEETKGLFGKTNVRVRAEVGPGAQASAPAAPAPAPAAPDVREDIQESYEEPAPAAVTEEAPTRGRRGRSRGGKGKADTDQESAAPQVAATSTASEDETVADGGGDVVATQEDADAILDLVRGLLQNADLQVNAQTAEISGKYVTIKLDGKDAAHLVGKHGEVLNAMQYLVNIIAARRLPKGVRATLDGNDYRRRREDALTSLATKIADQVKERGEEAVLDALPAFERRIVHKALAEVQGITTYSEGEEPNRRVVIGPAE